MIISPDEKDYHLIHEMIFKVLKRGQNPLIILEDVQKLLDKYNTRSFISGCTEFHILAKHLKLNRIDSIQAIDPLTTIAETFFQLLDSSSSNSLLLTKTMKLSQQFHS
jgi:aspartate racemase